MLEQMRRQGASIFIYFIFGLLIVIFVINFAPQGNTGEGCGLSSNTAVNVDGVETNNTAYMVAYSANGARGRDKTYVALEQVVRRELLAQAATARGILTTGELVDDDIQRKRGSFFIGGERIDFSRQFYDEVDGEKFFNIKRFKLWINQLNVSSGSYREEQSRGMQAALYSELIAGIPRVSREEALAEYLYDHDTVTYDVVAFDPTKYKNALRLTDADVARFIEGHASEVEARYKADEALYKGLKPEFAIRAIFIPKALAEAAPPAEPAKPADPAAKTDDKKPTEKATDKATDKPAEKVADKKPAAGAPKPYGLPVEEAKAKLEAVRTQIEAGKLTFADAEKQLAADSSEDAPASNGDLGWRKLETAELGEKAINDAVKTLQKGQMTPVIVGDRGVYLVTAMDKREGDLSFDQVKAEIAKKLAIDVWAKEAAKRDALDALAKAQGQQLEKLYERQRAPIEPGMEDLFGNPGLTPEQRQQLLEQIMKNQKQGALGIREVDVPVAWKADDGSAAPAGGGTPATPPAPAAPAAAATGSAAPAAGSAAPAAPAAVPAATAAATAPPAVVEATKDVLPALTTVAKPKLNRFGPMPRQTKMPGVGGAKPAIAALFEGLTPGSLAKQVYEGENGAYVVFQLVDRAQPKVEEFDKRADQEIARLQEQRGRAAVNDYVKHRCEELAKAGKIRPSADRIRETDDDGKPLPTRYAPCMYMDQLGRGG